MKLNVLNTVDPVITGSANNSNHWYLDKNNASVGIFQSQNHSCIKWCEKKGSGEAPSILIPQDEFNLQKIIYPEINELKGLFGNRVPQIIWLGKDVATRNIKRNPDHIIAHELQHVEQITSNQVAFYKSRILSFWLPYKNVPSEIDANNFANKVISANYDKNYNWVNKSEILFNEKLKDIHQYNELITRGDHDIIGLSKNKGKLFKYYFDEI